MEEEKKQGKLSYEELNQAASELHANYQKLMAEYQKAIGEINRLQFEGVAFELSMLFKVLENKSVFSNNDHLKGTGFIDWCVMRIHDGIVAYDKILQEQVPVEEEKKDEAK